LTATDVLQVVNCCKEFGGLVANDSVCLSIHAGEILGLIGPNGAGKTTLFNCIAGYYPPTSGKTLFRGRDITKWHANRTCRAGIARTFQIMKPVQELTALENVMIGAFSRTNDVGQARRNALKIVEEVGLISRAEMLAKHLTHADRRRLEIARAWATEPVLLLLDEAIAGLTPAEIQKAIALVRHIRQSGVTIFMVEHVMDAIMPLADRVIVMDAGRIIMEGTPNEVLRNERVIKAYLGQELDQSESMQGEQPC